MVYWGCSTTRNRCAWAFCTAFAVAATACLCVGAGQMWLCNHRGSAGLQSQQELGSCRVKAGIVMALCPVLMLLGVLPSLLFFQSCMAEAPPQAVDWEKNVPASGITVVRRTSNGPAVYRYDAHGKLLQAPDCYRHMTRTPQSPSKLYTGPSWLTHSADFDAQHTSGGGVQSPGRVSFAAPMLSISTGSQLSSSSSSSSNHSSRAQGSPHGQLQYSASGRQYSPQPRQYSPQPQQYSPQPRQYSPQSRQYSGQGSTDEQDSGTAEVYICLSPLTEGVNGGKK